MSGAKTSAPTFDEETLARAFASMELTPSGYWPPWINAIDRENIMHIIADTNKCFLPLECYDYLPFPDPPLEKAAVQTFESQIFCTMAECPLFVVFPITTPILACLLTGLPSRQGVIACRANIDRFANQYNEEYTQSGKTATEFLTEDRAKALANNIFEWRARLRDEEYKLKTKKGTSWPYHISTYVAFGYYQKIIDTMVSVAAFTANYSESQKERIQACYRQLRASIDGLLLDYVENNKEDAGYRLAGLAQSLSQDFEVYNSTYIPEHMESYMRVYTREVISLMEQCIMRMIGIPKEFAEKLVFTNQKELDENDPAFHTDQLMQEQKNLTEVRTCAFVDTWGYNKRMIARSASTPNIYKTASYQLWVFNQLARRVQTLEQRRESNSFLGRVQRGILDPITDSHQLSIQFY